MKSIQTAFYEGVVTKLLLNKWVSSHKGDGNPLNAYDFKVKMMRILKVVSILLLIAFSKHIISSAFALVVILSLLVWIIACYCGDYGAADICFVRDCYKLNKVIQYTQMEERNTPDGLLATAEVVLVSHASTVLQCQAKPESMEDAGPRLKRFKDLHKLFLRFGLAEPAWDKYFALAKEKMKPKEETVIA